MMDYAFHCADMKKWKQEPMSEKQFDEMQQQENGTKVAVVEKQKSERKQLPVRNSLNWLNPEQKRERRSIKEKAKRLEKKASQSK